MHFLNAYLVEIFCISLFRHTKDWLELQKIMISGANIAQFVGFIEKVAKKLTLRRVVGAVNQAKWSPMKALLQDNEKELRSIFLNKLAQRHNAKAVLLSLLSATVSPLK